MATIELTNETFDDIAFGDGLVLVDFWAEWCGPCRSFAPVFERASEQHPGATFGKVDTEAERELQARFQIRSIPTLMVIRDGIVLYAEPGALPEKALDQLIGKAEELDMDDVRKQIAEAEAQTGAASAS